MNKTIYKIDGIIVHEDIFLESATEGAFNFIDSCIKDNQVFKFDGHRFIAESYIVSELEMNLINSLDSIIEYSDRITFYRNAEGYLYMGYYFEAADSIMFTPLNDQYFPFIGEEETLSIEEIKALLFEGVAA